MKGRGILGTLYDKTNAAISQLILTAIFRTTTGLTSEKVYWKYILMRGNGYRESRRLEKEEQKRVFPMRMRELVQKKARVLEIGPGPLSDLIWGVREGFLEVEGLDPLADAYQKMLERKRVKSPVRLVTGKAEQMQYDEEFDIVYGRNSLDHVEDASISFANMVRAVRPGGFVYVTGNVREGTKVNWTGLHKHDLLLEEDELVHYDPAGERTVLTGDMPLEVVHAWQTGTQPGDWFTLILKKTHSLSRSTPRNTS